MASGDELRNRARDLERAHRIPEALEVYLQLAAELQGGRAAAVWQRVGRLQEQAGDPPAATDSYARAIELYTVAGQRNNALALCESLGDGEAAALSVHVARLRLALELGYAAFAREAIVPLMLVAIRGEANGEAVEQIARFFERYGSDSRYSPAAIVASLPAADEQRAAGLLARVWSSLATAGAVDMADRVRTEILRIDPDLDPKPGAAPPSSTPASAPAAASIPLVVPTVVAEEAPSLEIPLLEGLEPTHAGLERERSPEDDEDLAPPPPAGMVAPAPAGPAVDETLPLEEEEEGEDEPLPLLRPTERFTRPVEQPTAPAERAAGSAGGSPDSLQEVDGEADLDGILLTDREGRPEIPTLDVLSISRELERIITREAVPSDAGSHYDVGVAFKEMGMVEDAIANLSAALAAGYNPVATLEVLGEILIEQDRYDAASRVLEFARTAGAEYDEAMAGVLYWLARSDEVRGRTDEACALLTRVVQAAPAYRDAAQRLAALCVS